MVQSRIDNQKTQATVVTTDTGQINERKPNGQSRIENPDTCNSGHTRHWTNKRERKSNGQARIDNTEAQETEQSYRKLKYTQHRKLENKTQHRKLKCRATQTQPYNRGEPTCSRRR